MNGILCMNKPEGYTSFDVIGKLRGILRVKRLGHAGTLDPMATGVLPVFVGKATKACDILPDNEKSYRAGFRLGLSTDTLDCTGTVTAYFEKRVRAEDIIVILPHFSGDIMQVPPMYSALSVGGRRLYDLARQGIVIERKPRHAAVSEIRLEGFDALTQTGTLFIACSKGTYIRTLIDDIGAFLGCGGIMTDLTRLSSSGFTIDMCHTFEDVEMSCREGTVQELLIPVESVFESLPVIRLSEMQSRMYKNGVKLDLLRINNIAKGYEVYRIYGNDGVFIGTALADWDRLELKTGKNMS